MLGKMQRLMPESDLQLWNWINEYVVACGGDPSSRTTSSRRMDAVARVEETVFEIADRHYKACR